VGVESVTIAQSVTSGAGVAGLALADCADAAGGESAGAAIVEHPAAASANAPATAPAFRNPDGFARFDLIRFIAFLRLPRELPELSGSGFDPHHQSVAGRS